MLVLTRKLGEVIALSDEIAVQVIEIRGNKVRLGVAAPRRVTVDCQVVHARRASRPRATPATVCTFDQAID